MVGQSVDMANAQNDGGEHKISIRFLILVVGFSLFRSFDPALSYYVPYWVTDKGLTNFEITNRIMPIISYGSLISTILAAPACEYLSYWTVNHIYNIVLLIGSLILRFGSTLLMMQIMEIFSSLGNGTYTVFQTYLYFFVTTNGFQKMTSINQASNCASLFFSAELGQFLLTSGISYNTLVDICIAAKVITCIMSFLLPKEKPKKKETGPVMLNLFKTDQGFWSTIKDTWKDKHLQILSLWWAASIAGFGMSLNYGTTLFQGISSNTEYNGHVIAAATACSSLSSLSSMYLKEMIMKTGDAVYIVGTAVSGVLCFTMALSKSLLTAYLAYIGMTALEYLLICFVYAQCGALLRNERYILLFSFNTGLALLLMAIIQAVIEIIGLDIFSQYIAIGGYFMAITVAFSILYGIYLWCSYTTSSSSEGVADAEETICGVIHSLDQPLLQNFDSEK